MNELKAEFEQAVKELNERKDRLLQADAEFLAAEARVESLKQKLDAAAQAADQVLRVGQGRTGQRVGR